MMASGMWSTRDDRRCGRRLRTQVAAHRIGRVLDQGIALQPRDRRQRLLALDGEQHFEEGQITTRNCAAGAVAPEFGAHDLQRVVVTRADRLTQHLAPGVIGHGLAVGDRAPFQPGQRSRAAAGQLADFGGQPRLAQPGLAQHGHDGAAAVVEAGQRLPESVELRVPPDQRRVQPLQAAR
jgi:hypothetical protein